MEKTPGFWTTLWRVYRKDSTLEWKSPAGILAVVLFGIILAAIYHYAMLPAVFKEERNLFGILLATLFFSSSMAPARNAQLEKEAGALEICLLAPADPAGYFMGKTLALWQLQILYIAVYIPCYYLLLLGTLPATPAAFLAPFFNLGLTALSLSALGVLLAYIATGNRFKDLLLPLLLLPAALPVFMLATDGLERSLASESIFSFRQLFALLAPGGLYCGLGSLFYTLLSAED